MPDYAKLIDAETWEYIRETENWYPADAVAQSVQNQRQTYDRMCVAFFAGYPPGVKARDAQAGGVPVRLYTKSGATAGPVVMFMHGGGFVVGGLDSHDDICAEICDATGCDVISVDYRLAPEHLHPAAYDDCMTAYRWIEKTFARPVILCGDSAGGNLAACVAHTNRGHKGIAGQVLVYPGLGADRSKASFVTHAHAPMLTLQDILFYEKIRTGTAPPTDDPTYAPLNDTDFSNLPATVIFTAQCDPLASNGPDYCDAINTAGGHAICIREAGLVHGYLRARHRVKRARRSFDRMLRAISLIGAGKPVSHADLKT